MASSAFRALRTPLALMALGAAGLAAGCSHNSAEAREEKLPPLKGSEAIDRDAYGKLGYALAWSSFASIDRLHNGVPDKASVLGDLLVIADDTTATSALTTSSGQLKWGLKVDDRAGRFLAIARRGDTVLAMNETELFGISTDTGDMTLRQKLPRLASTPPVVFDTTVVYASSDMIVAHSTLIKEQVWAYRAPAPILTDPVWVGDEAVCFVAGDGTVAVIDCAHGNMLGLNKMYGNAGAMPAAGDGAVFVPGLDQSLWAFEAVGGQRRWQLRTETPLTSSPAVVDQHVMINIPGQGMVCVNARTGNKEWTNPQLKGRMVAIRKGNPIFFDRQSGTAATIDVARGDIIDQVTLGNVWLIVNGRSFADGDLYTISKRGEVSKFVPR